MISKVKEYTTAVVFKVKEPLAEHGPLNFFEVKQAMLKAVVPEIAKIVTSIVTEAVAAHNAHFKGSPLI